MTFSVYWVRLQQPQEQLHAFLPGSVRCFGICLDKPFPTVARVSLPGASGVYHILVLIWLTATAAIPLPVCTSLCNVSSYSVYLVEKKHRKELRYPVLSILATQYIFKPHSPIVTWGECLPCCDTPVAWRKVMLFYFNVQGEFKKKLCV